MRPLFLLLMLAGLSLGAGDAVVAAGVKADYRVGDRLAQPASPSSSIYRETDWDALVPKDWDPLKELRALNLGKLKDSDPRADKAMQRMKELWNSAPVIASLRGERIRIAGFMIPLERKGDLVTEFLLVPYFGACIHVPPPPANQIIHVVATKPLAKAQTMDAMWVSGTLDIAHADSPWGASGYTMKGDVVVPYTGKH